MSKVNESRQVVPSFAWIDEIHSWLCVCSNPPHFIVSKRFEMLGGTAPYAEVRNDSSPTVAMTYMDLDLEPY